MNQRLAMQVMALAVTATLTACGGGGGSNPTSQPVPAAVNTVPVATAPTLYQGQGVFAAYTGLEPTVIVENGMVRLWYTAEDLLDASYAPGQANYGKTGYPFKNVRIAYMEMSAAAFATAVQTGQPLQWSAQGDCVPNLMHSSVARGANGVYYLSGTNTTTNQEDLWQSTTGYPGTWSLVKTNITPLNAITGNTWMNWNRDHWEVWAEYLAANTQWRASYWTGPTLDALTRQDSDTAPAMVGANGTTTSVGQVVMTATGYAKFNHDSLTAAPTPTDLSFWSSAAAGSGWTQNAWVLRLEDIKNFMGDSTQPFNGDSQLADPTVVEINGNTYMVYETIRQELYDVPSLSVAWWPETLDQVISGYQQ